MNPTDPSSLILHWVKVYTTTLRKFLGALGVRCQEDRADISQEVFCIAYRSLVRGQNIENPPAFLYGCAKKQASNYRRKASRRTFRAYSAEDEPVDVVRTPEQLVSASELVELAHEHLDEKARSILFEVADGGSTWSDMARAREITVDQVRYLHERAVVRVAEAAQPELKKRKRRALVLLPALDQLFASAPTGNTERTPGPLQRLWGLLQGRFQQVSRPPRSSALALTFPPLRARPRVLGVLAGGLVIGSLLPGKLSDAPRSEAATVALHAEQATSSVPLPTPPVEEVRPADPAPQTVTLTAATTPPARRSGPARQSSSRAPVPVATEMPGSLTLLDRARREYGRGNLRGALELLAQHEVRFPVGPDTKHRRLLTRLACAAAAGANECSKTPRTPGSTAGR